MAPTASFHSPKVEYITKTVTTLAADDSLKETGASQWRAKSSLEEDKIANELRYFQIARPLKEDRSIRYIYIDESRYGLVWPNIIMFVILHAYYIYAMTKVIFFEEWWRIQNTWLFGWSIYLSLIQNRLSAIVVCDKFEQNTKAPLRSGRVTSVESLIKQN